MSHTETSDCLTVGIAQISPVWLNREQTLDKIIAHVYAAAKEGCQLVVFGEALLPGYPFWIELTDGARFNSPLQKEMHAHYMNIRKERQNFDPAGHYSRPDITQLTINRQRQGILNIVD